MIVHDLAYADLAFDMDKAPSLMQVPGAKDVGVEFFSMSKSYSMAGWRLAFAVGNPEMIGALTKLKSYLDYGVFQPIQIAGIIALNECPEVPKQIREIYRSRRDALCEGLDRIGWDMPVPPATMFAWAPIPEEFARLGSLEFAKMVCGGEGRDQSRDRLRTRGRRSRALRAGRERATYQAGAARPPDPDRRPLIRLPGGP